MHRERAMRSWRRPARIFFISGPGDVVGTFRHWKQGHDDPSQMSVTWSGQFFDVCRKLGLEAYVVAWAGQADREADARFTVVNRPKPEWSRRGGWRYHLGEQWYVLRMIAGAIRFRADTVLMAGGLPLMLFRVLRALRIRFIVDFSCVLWRKYLPIGRTWGVVHRLERPILRDQAFALLSMSCDITSQLVQVAGNRPRPIVEYLPLYRRDRIQALPAPAGQPFRVVFAGRVEAYKGAYQLVELARRFRRSGRDILIELCGDGGALREVERRVAEEDLSSHLVVHGYCMFDELRRIYARAHSVIVPTTAEFAEGFNMVVAEAVLAGRPVVTSAVCPAVHYLGDAVVQVPVDDVDAYERAIERLADDPKFYAQTRDAGSAVRERFFDPQNSFGAGLEGVLRAAQAEQSPAPRTVPLGLPGGG
jgi:glycosyltransferase involved in cell wall biosynthesis